MRSSFVTTSYPAIAVIDGSLRRLSRSGAVVATHTPIATAILEFHHGPMRFYIREHPFGLLPGVPNLYAVDADFRMQWLAEWPLGDNPCARIIEDEDNVLTVESVSGAVLQFDASTGRLLSCAHRMAAAS